MIIYYDHNQQGITASNLGDDGIYTFDRIEGPDYDKTIINLKKVNNSIKDRLTDTSIEKHIRGLIADGAELKFEVWSAWESSTRAGLTGIVELHKRCDSSSYFLRIEEYSEGYSVRFVCGREIKEFKFKTIDELDAYVLKWILSAI